MIAAHCGDFRLGSDRVRAYNPAGTGITRYQGPTAAGGGMASRNHNLQDVFLNTVRRERAAVTVFLVNGVKLQGVITWFDSFCMLLRRDGHSQLIYKHAISTIMPQQPISLKEVGEPDRPEAARPEEDTSPASTEPEGL